MKRMISSFVVALVALLVLPETASAQVRRPIYEIGVRPGTGSYPGRYNSYGGGRFYGYGGYELEVAQVLDFLKMPGILSACRLATSKATGKLVATDCHIIVRGISPEGLRAQLGSHLESNVLGTQHPEKGGMDFRAYDATHRPFNRNHKDCIPVEPSADEVSSVQENGGVSSGGQAAVQPSAGSARSETVSPEILISWTTVNITNFPALVVDPNNGKKTVVPKQGTVELPSPAGPKKYQVQLMTPGVNETKPVPAQIQPSKDLSHWEIVALS